MCEDSEELWLYKHPNAHIREAWYQGIGGPDPGPSPPVLWPGVAWWLWPCGTMPGVPAVGVWWRALATGSSTRIQSQRGGKSCMLQVNGEDLFWTYMSYCLDTPKTRTGRGFCSGLEPEKYCFLLLLWPHLNVMLWSIDNKQMGKRSSDLLKITWPLPFRHRSPDSPITALHLVTKEIFLSQQMFTLGGHSTVWTTRISWN